MLVSQRVERLQRLAKRWQVSKTEAIRRALAKADETDALTSEDRVAALHALQRLTTERNIDVKKWQQDIKDARR